MREIRGEARTIRQLLSGSKYAIDYYQREYKWQTKQVVELLEDLADKFLNDFDAGHDRSEVEKYGHYFLGSIIISQKDGQKFIIDGQQRLTTLSLLLIFLYNLQQGKPDEVKHLGDLIFSEQYGKKSFNLNVEERIPAMEALFTKQAMVNEADQPESVRNIVARYKDIEDNFSESLSKDALPYFIDWLIQNVHMVEITAYSDEDAYTIFETMNDRGLSLTPTDMLKGFVLANISDESQKLKANQTWKDCVSELLELGKETDADAFKTWLRSQYAQTIRERKKGATPGDFDRLGTEFHRWVRDHRDVLKLQKSGDFFAFVERDLAFYAKQYRRVRQASLAMVAGLEAIFYNAQHEFTMQYPLLLAPLRVDDAPDVIDQKLRIVANYLDIVIARRLWNFRVISYSTVQYGMFQIIKEIRGKSPKDLVRLLLKRLEDEQETFASNELLHVHQQNRKAIHQFLARMTDHLERQSGLAGRYLEYISGSGTSRYEVEHIWAYKPERHIDEFPASYEFSNYRNRIGGLLLLPKSFNASYGALTYEEKLEHYNSQNLLARSLHSGCYDHNPGFLGYLERSGLPFKAHLEFKKADLDQRQMLYQKLAEEIWSPQRLEKEVEG
ncbi:MAG: hypothetical protein RLZZ511_3642 [Cyanobacteriota bacterium]|jgi:hypothetical protein